MNSVSQPKTNKMKNKVFFEKMDGGWKQEDFPEENIKISFVDNLKKGTIKLDFPLDKGKLLFNDIDLSREYEIVSKRGNIIFGVVINPSNLMNPVTRSYIAVTKDGRILGGYTRDYRNYFDKSVKEWKDQIVEELKDTLNTKTEQK